MELEEIALRIYIGMLAKPDYKANPSPMLGHSHAQIAFILAETFLVVAGDEKTKQMKDRLTAYKEGTDDV